MHKDHLYYNRYPVRVFFLLFFFLIQFHVYSESLPAVPRASKGVLDLRHWDFSTRQQLSLDGEWMFFWQEFLPADSDFSPYFDEKADFIRLPGYWNRTEYKGTVPGGRGYATLVLKVLLPEAFPILGIRTQDILTAYSLSINGHKLHGSGTPGVSVKTSFPSYKTGLSRFSAETDTLTIVLHISNFHSRMGGTWSGIILGSYESLEKRSRLNFISDIILICSILFMGIFNLLLYSLYPGKERKAALYFSLFCLTIVIRILVTGDCLAYSLFPGGWNILHRLEYLTLFCSVPFFFRYLDGVFKDLYPGLLKQLTSIACLVFSLVLFLPSYYYTFSVQAYQILLIGFCLSFVFYLIKALKKKFSGAVIIFTGFMVLFVFTLNDILYTNQIIHTGEFVSVGMFFFIFSQTFILARQFTQNFHLAKLQAEELKETNQTLKEQIHKREILQNHLLRSRSAIIMGLAKLTEFRDEETGNHLERIQEYTRLLAKELSRHPEFEGYITEDYMEDLYRSSILHDIGKVGVPDKILLKPGKLEKSEWGIMKTHTTIGGETIQSIEKQINQKSFLTLGREIAFSHHEKWDGTGYPKGLKGREIPLSARIVAVADVFDALTSERPYKAPFSFEESCRIILEGEGLHFDPDIIAAFEKCRPRFREVLETLMDRSDASGNNP